MGLVSNLGGGKFFRTCPDPTSYTMNTGSFLEVRRPESGLDDPPTSSAAIKERVELYLYSPTGPSWTLLGRNLPVPFVQAETCS